LPANLTAEAKAKWNKAQQARNNEEKLTALQEFLSSIPKHKGNERLRAQTKRKIAQLRTEVQTKHGRSVGRLTERTIQKTGAAQIAVLGMTKSGRSSLLRALTAAKPVVADYPYATKDMIPGMLQFEDLQFQLIEVPALVPSEDGRFVLQEGSMRVLRNCEGLIIVLDLGADPVVQLDRILIELLRMQVSVTKMESNITIQKTRSGGVQLVTAGDLVGCTRTHVTSLLESYGMRNAIIRTTGSVSLDDIEDVILETNLTFKPTIVVANKVDLPSATEHLGRLLDRTGSSIPLIVVSCMTKSGLGEIGRKVFELLKIIRVYTKEPNSSSPSPEPFVVRQGTTVGNLSRQIHSELFDRFKYARVWGRSVSYSGERVGVDHVLLDKDVVEIHA